MRLNRPIYLILALTSILCLAGPAAAADSAPPQPQPINFVQETLGNGLRVIYAPLHTAPVIHVRVLYHVGSRDERPDRQGFAHMFEHMMFRGSAHVQPEEHMKRIGVVGGISNAFTSFDQTVYHDTIPAQDLEMTLYLEADRMSSFKVSDSIFQTEREVVAKEWGMQQNQPYGNLYQNLLNTAFTTHSYRWTPIGNMDQLKQSRVEELQDFFNTYYLPNNALLVIAGDIDVDAAKALVHKYFGWIPPGPPIVRLAEPEPAQTQPRRAVDPEVVPLPAVVVGWHLPPYRSDDLYALNVLDSILGDGDSSRLKRLLVHSEKPLCADAYCLSVDLEDGGLFGVGGIVLLGKNPDEVEKILDDAIADIRDHGVTEEELTKAKTQIRTAEIKSRLTATDIATILGEETLFGGDANRVNTEPAKIDAITAADIQAVARKYLSPESSTTLRVQPDPLRIAARRAATQPAAVMDVLPATRPIVTRDIRFPDGYPVRAPDAGPAVAVNFNKGVEQTIDGVKVVVLTDPRLPTVHWSLTLPRGSHSDPTGKEGLAELTDAMLTRGAGDLTFAQLHSDLDFHGIDLNVSDGGDYTRLECSCTVDQVGDALLRSQVLLQPTFPEDQFAALKEQSLNTLLQNQENPTTVALQEMWARLNGPTPLGRHSTPASERGITLDEVKACYAKLFQPTGALLIFSGDISVDDGGALAQKLLEGWKAGDTLPPVDYTRMPDTSARIILIDRPNSVQSVVRMGIPAYDIHNEQDKFPGSLAGQILTAGIDSKLMKYVRAEKGLAYSVTGVFAPNRHAGTFVAGVDTDVKLTGDAIAAMFEVFDKMRQQDVSPQELADAQNRVAGGMVMSMQTIDQQASLRGEGILNGYPIDYYDRYSDRVEKVTADQVRDVMQKYVDPEKFTIVVVGPADRVKDQLTRFGNVEVIPMPSHRNGSTSQPGELLQPTN
jgi:zinc protease